MNNKEFDEWIKKHIKTFSEYKAMNNKSNNDACRKTLENPWNWDFNFSSVEAAWEASRNQAVEEFISWLEQGFKVHDYTKDEIRKAFLENGSTNV